jgi:hypothetical protein
MKKTLFTAMILAVFALGCAANKGYTVAHNAKGENWHKQCPGCFMGCPAQVADVFADSIVDEAVEQCKETGWSSNCFGFNFYYDVVYVGGKEGRYFYIKWVSEQPGSDGTAEFEELAISTSWILVNSKEKKCQSITTDDLSELKPVIKVLANAVLEKKSADKIWEDLKMAIAAVNLGFSDLDLDLSEK